MSIFCCILLNNYYVQAYVFIPISSDRTAVHRATYARESSFEAQVNGHRSPVIVINDQWAQVQQHHISEGFTVLHRLHRIGQSGST